MQVASQVLSILDSHILPWIEQISDSRLIIAPAYQRDFFDRNDPLPSNVTCSESATAGKRKSVHGARPHGNRSVTSAVWPEDKLVAPRMPIIICPFEGHIDFCVGDYVIHSGPRNFILLPPGVPRDDGSSPHLSPAEQAAGATARSSLFWLRPNERGLECWICHSQGKRHWGGAVEDHLFILHRETYSYFLTLNEEAVKGAANWHSLSRGLLLALLSILHRDLSAGRFYGREQMGQSLPEITRLNDPISYAQQYIREHLNEPLTIEHVAQAVYLARTQFTTRFRAQTGQSFSEFVNQCRLEKAQSLLRETPLAVRVVSHLVGIQPSHLRRLFMRHHGISPDAYRREHQNQNAHSEN